MEAKSDSEILANRILRLEEIVRAQNDLLMTLSERIGDTFARQAFSVKDLMDRENFTVLEAADGEAAEELFLAAKNIDLII